MKDDCSLYGFWFGVFILSFILRTQFTAIKFMNFLVAGVICLHDKTKSHFHANGEFTFVSHAEKCEKSNEVGG